jgi:transposase-like protein
MTLSDLAQQFDVHPNQIAQWKARFLEGAAGVFDGRPGRTMHHQNPGLTKHREGEVIASKLV